MRAHPFLKWVGSKRQLLAQMEPLVPKEMTSYCEPFVGGGALFFHLQPKCPVVLSDANERLIRTYRGVRDSVDEVLELLHDVFAKRHSKEFFLAIRGTDVDQGSSDAEVAAWFIYLNRVCFNGLYRVNKANKFNVPFGDYVKLTIDEKNLRACSRALQGVQITMGDFANAAILERGSFAYFDPPYVPLSSTSSFASYTAGGFGMEEQKRLANHARILKARGVKVLLSNSGAPAVRELYEGFELIPIQARRAVNSRVDRRGNVLEYLIR